MKNMSKWVAMALALVMMLAMAGAATAEDASLADLQARGKLVLGLDESFPPMGFRDEDNQIVGFDIDLAKEVCARLGVELVLQPIDWDTKEMELDSGNVDCIWNGMSRTEEREAAMALSIDYMNNQMVFLCNNEAYQSRADLAGKVLAVQNGSYAQKMMEREDQAELAASMGEVRGYPDYLTAIMDMQNGNVDAVLIDVVVANYRIAGLGDAALFTMDPVEDDLYCIGFRKADEALRDAVNETLVAMQADGAVEAIANVWFGENISIIPAA